MDSKLFPIDEISNQRSNSIISKLFKKHESKIEDASPESKPSSPNKGMFHKLIQRESPHWQYYSGTFTSCSAIKHRQDTSKVITINEQFESRVSNFLLRFKNKIGSKKIQKTQNVNKSKLVLGQIQHEITKKPHCYVALHGKDQMLVNNKASWGYFKLSVKNYTLPTNAMANKSTDNYEKVLIYFGDDLKVIKVFSSNYVRGEFLHIFPDFGWRLLINNNILTKSIKPIDLSKISLVSFYKESRQVQFSTCLIVLAINISVRAARIGAKFGLIKLTPLVAQMFPFLVENENENNFEEFGPDILYSDSARLGLFTPQINLNFNNTNEFYTALGLPDYGWRLYKKSTLLSYFEKGCSSKVAKATRYPNALFSQMQLCDGFITLVDIASYAMNMTELLYRLEIWDPSREKFPKNMYNFKISHRDFTNCTINDVNGTSYSIILEELIINVSTFLQSSFITQSLLLS